MSLCFMCKTTSSSLTVISTRLCEFLRLVNRVNFKSDALFCENCIKKVQHVYDKKLASYAKFKESSQIQQSSENISLSQSPSVSMSDETDRLIARTPLCPLNKKVKVTTRAPTKNLDNELQKSTKRRIISDNDSEETSSLPSANNTSSIILERLNKELDPLSSQSLSQPIAVMCFSNSNEETSVPNNDTQKLTTSGGVDKYISSSFTAPDPIKRVRFDQPISSIYHDTREALTTIGVLPLRRGSSSSENSINEIMPGLNHQTGDGLLIVPGPANLANVQPYVTSRSPAAIVHIDNRDIPIYRRQISGG